VWRQGRSEVKGGGRPKACWDPTGQPQRRVLVGHSLGRLAAHFLWSHPLHCGKNLMPAPWSQGHPGAGRPVGLDFPTRPWQPLLALAGQSHIPAPLARYLPGTCPVPAQSCQRPWRLSLWEPGSSCGTVGTSHPHPSGSRAESAGWGGGPHGLGGAGRWQPEALLFWAFSGAGGPDGA